MNSVDIAYRYICFFKIYEAWHDHREKFFINSNNARPKIVITRNLLAKSYREKQHKQFLNKSFNDKYLYEELNKIRKYLVHPFINRGGIPASFCNLDHIEVLEVTETMSNLIERIATKILDVELNLMAINNKNIMDFIAVYRP